jgi:hypothetical protein
MSILSIHLTQNVVVMTIILKYVLEESICMINNVKRFEDLK